ncbi:hypothetical protein B5G26_13775 [Anaerotignum lactatifermentans]|jgi:hypothetical protein|uniref:Uncharacterized protein n=1 Tax=Anaerotignum lactatifermentans TaxID=160404 RepID=A0A1Y3TWE4_9FIRM|nr:hypothetical protein B5G26_13775 [Anaerotignum lactatifermentans]
MADQISWDIIVFEEANVLSTVPMLCGQLKDDIILSEIDCQKMLQKPILSYTEKTERLIG